MLFSPSQALSVAESPAVPLSCRVGEHLDSFVLCLLLQVPFLVTLLHIQLTHLTWPSSPRPHLLWSCPPHISVSQSLSRLFLGLCNADNCTRVSISILSAPASGNGLSFSLLPLVPSSYLETALANPRSPPGLDLRARARSLPSVAPKPFPSHPFRQHG